MTQEDKKLLLKDLCARLVYEVKVKYWPDSSVWGKHISPETCLLTMDILTSVFKKEYSKKECLPYLRPMSSMTENEMVEFKWLNGECDKMPTFDYIPVEHYRLFDWLNRNHFDYRGLIERGLALEAPEGMYKID